MPAGGVHAIVGADSFLAEQALERILSDWVGEQDRTSAVEVLRGEESGWHRVVDAARSGSLFASRRAVVVRRAEQLKGDDAVLLEYLGDPNPDVALVLLYAKLDKRKGSAKQLARKAEVVAADPLKGRALKGYVAAEVKRRQLPLPAEALDELVERVGQDLRRLIGELDKLEAWSEGDEPLSADDVAKVLGRGIAQPLYRLSDAFAQRRIALALELLDELLDEGEPPLKILATLHRSLRQVVAARSLTAARVPYNQAQQRLLGDPVRMLPFKVAEVLRTARTWPEGALERAQAALLTADERIKTSIDGRVALTGAIVASLGSGTAR